MQGCGILDAGHQYPKNQLPQTSIQKPASGNLGEQGERRCTKKGARLSNDSHTRKKILE